MVQEIEQEMEGRMVAQSDGVSANGPAASVWMPTWMDIDEWDKGAYPGRPSQCAPDRLLPTGSRPVGVCHTRG